MTVALCGPGPRGYVSAWRSGDATAAATLVIAETEHDKASLEAARVGTVAVVRRWADSGHSAQCEVRFSTPPIAATPTGAASYANSAGQSDYLLRPKSDCVRRDGARAGRFAAGYRLSWRASWRRDPSPYTR